MGSRVIALVLVSIAASAAGPAYLAYRAFSAYAVTSAGTELQRYGGEVLLRSGGLVEGHILALQALATSPDVVSIVRSSNAANAERDPAELEAWIAATDKAWAENLPQVADTVESVVGNSVSSHFKSFISAVAGQVEVFVTDSEGVAVAESNRTSDLMQADEDWWQATWAGGSGAVFIGDVEYDESSKAWGMDIGVPVREPGGKAIGVLRGTVNVSVLVDALGQIVIGQEGHVGLLAKDATIISAPGHEASGDEKTPAPAGIAALAQEGKSTWREGIPDFSGQPAVVAVATMKEGMASSLGWVLVATLPLAEAHAPALAASLNSVKVTALVAVVLMVFALVSGRALAAPLRSATEAARALGIGDSERAVELVTRFACRRDEVGELSRAFVELAARTSAIAKVAHQVAGGDLTASVTARSDRDELSLAVAEMVEQMRDLVGQVAESTRQLLEGVGQVDEAMSQVARSAMSQTESVETATNAMERLMQGVGDVAAGAREQAESVGRCSASTDAISAGLAGVLQVAQAGAQAARAAADKARGAAQTVRATAEGMNDIREGTDLAAQRVREMGERSEQIGEIIETVEDIAAQTNLLALNAAIEAARAGEHGRGFAVVADEVRKLAEGAGSAAQEIGGLVRTMREAIEQAMAAMNRGNAEVEKGMAQATRASEAIDGILAEVDDVARQVQEITSAAEAMADGARDLVSVMGDLAAIVERYSEATDTIEAEATGISDQMSGIVAISEENSAAAQEVAATTDLLRGMAGQVDALVGRFRLS